MFKITGWFMARRTLSAWLLAGVILLTMFLVAFLSSRGAFGDPGDSGTVDEIAHIPSGYSYDRYQDFRLNPEHPPLAKALAGLPLALNNKINGIKADWSWDGINQWEAGWYMLYEAGNNPKEVLLWARLPMMLLMIGLGLFLFKWAKELFGKKIALLVLVLYAFYPDVIAHGRLVTTDVAAAFGYVLALYYFDKALTERVWKWTIIGALAFAVAQLLKFSAFLLFFVFLILIIARAVMGRKEDGSFLKSVWKHFKTYFWVCAISVIFVWAAYVPFVWNTPLSVEHELIERNLTDDPRTLPLRNFEHLFESNPIMRGLGHYTLGMMLVIGRVESGNATYVLGHSSDRSISWYFPAAWALKTPITIIILSLLSIAYIVARWPKDKEKKWLLIVILSPIIVYWAFTLRGSLNIGIRHLLPTVPFVLLLIGYFLYNILNNKAKAWQKWGVGLLVVYMVASTLSNYPNFIAYFNELTPRDARYTRLIDSSLDWGQDLLRLKSYIDENKIETIKVDYFGGSVPSYYIPQSANWHSEFGPTTGWLAISATFYQSSKLYGEMEGKWSYSWLDKIRPKAIIGGSILVFNITEEDLVKNPPESPYPITNTQGNITNSIFNEQKQ